MKFDWLKDDDVVYVVPLIEDIWSNSAIENQEEKGKT